MNRTAYKNNSLQNKTGNQKESCLQDSPPAAGRFSDIIPLRRSVLLPGGLYFFIGKFNEISYKEIKLCPDVVHDTVLFFCFIFV